MANANLTQDVRFFKAKKIKEDYRIEVAGLLSRLLEIVNSFQRGHVNMKIINDTLRSINIITSQLSFITNLLEKEEEASPYLLANPGMRR